MLGILIFNETLQKPLNSVYRTIVITQNVAFYKKGPLLMLSRSFL